MCVKNKLARMVINDEMNTSVSKRCRTDLIQRTVSDDMSSNFRHTFRCTMRQWPGHADHIVSFTYPGCTDTRDPRDNLQNATF